MGAKVCTKCGQSKDLSEFYKSARASDGKQSECKVCHKKQIDARWLKKHGTPRYGKNVYRKAKKYNPVAEKARYRRDKAKRQRRNQLLRINMKPSYIAALCQLSKNYLSPELLELKREQLEITRELRKLRKAIKNVT